MKKVFIYLSLLLIYIPLHSQKIRVKDRINDKPIPFATAILISNGIEKLELYTDDNGIFELPENAVYDMIKLISLGYEDVYLAKSTISNSIYMISKPVLLQEVAINFTRRLKDTILGQYNVKRSGKGSIIVQSQIAVFFENPFHEEMPLKEFRVKIHKVKYKTAVRIHFFCRRDYVQKLYLPNDPEKKYVPHDSFVPSDDITGQNIIAYVMPGDKEFKINLLDYNITLPYDGVFAGIECIGYFDQEEKSITVENKNLTQLEYHETSYDNYCEKIKLHGGFWLNVNKHLKADTFMMGVTLDRDSYQAPTMGLVVSK